ncbi:UDP-N-acetylmuramoyl-tripeptide--D-alanyl-D-alanine ligase [Edwardsiella hoshinae]|uniref:UDP-N-acetylmuramoyl-tripeptide--D-alanyl-D-alanine ligase n=1 Tax=Edwardsiella hoshinae TaxID=93378 RepID=A0A376DL30_9GAMM|nr:UDP-N-acetylmuramoyl-tripeptide--D-alanyl-D-alanine ligase [Edwardsiella hoshinae]QPR29282.1 UDP-N-acetylmuramoyl-tripeptide--D-alanyl-D-alanine ligase [Edwardsiella hoshinae]STC90870.1 UDP-N-acetylmuramoyl-tripeptide--D-alanyl-D-alanine ligase [Edwardsiella hoshinae]
MIATTLRTLADVLDATLYGDDAPITAVTTDTRKLTPGCLFIALQGEHFDGHDFAARAGEGGAGALLVNRRLPLALPQLVVADTRLALGQLGAWVRSQVPARVVALTGSSGKTSVKEMSAAILAQCGTVLYTAGNLNNDIGVPLTLLRLEPQHDFAVIELGANHVGEIAYSVALTRPHSALVNNLAAAHLEGFGSLAGVARAKGEIFTTLPAQGTAILNADSNDWDNWRQTLTTQRVWRFSPQGGDDVDFYASEVRSAVDGTHFVLHTPEGQIAVTLPLPGRHNIANALAAAALTMSVGASLTQVRQGLAGLQAVPGRLYPIRLGEQQLLLDDSYNANVGSMSAAAEVLGSMPGYRVMVVGDMAELGAEAEACHRRVGEAARAAGIDKVLSVGGLSRLIGEASGCGEHYMDQGAVIERLKHLLCEHAAITILVKGSRSAAMEQVVRGVSVQEMQENQSC